MTEAERHELRCVCCGRFLIEMTGGMGATTLRVRCTDRECRCWNFYRAQDGQIVGARQLRAPKLDKPGNLS